MARIKLLFIGLLAAVTLLGGWFFGRPVYQRYRESRAVDQAKACIAKGELRSASICARQALQINPRNIEACRVMAVVAESTHSPDVIEWYRRVVELSPTVEDKLTLVAAALESQSASLPLAAQTLHEVSGSAKEVPKFHMLAAQLALKLNQPGIAEAAFQTAVRLQPTNDVYRLNLAVLQLRSTNEVTSTEARATLDRLRANTNLTAIILRTLVADSLSRSNMTVAENLSHQLIHDPLASLEDRIQHLSILNVIQSPGLGSMLSTLQGEVNTNAAQVYLLSSWMVANERASEALAWLSNCPPNIRSEQPVAMAMADCLMARQDWGEVDTFLQLQKWGDYEFLRLALLSRAASERKDSASSDALWRSAVQQGLDRLGPLRALLAMAVTWGRDNARGDLLWRITEKFPEENWAARDLEKIYFADGNTAGLYKLYGTLSARNPKDVFAKNNYAATALLLKNSLPNAYEVARELYQSHPEESIVTATYAYSLFLQGKPAEALGTIEKLPASALQDPSVALYYGVLLSAQGQSAKAQTFLAIAKRGTLLPEERQLLAQAFPQ